MKAFVVSPEGKITYLKSQEKRLYTVGRSRQADIQFADPAVSKQHATLYLSVQGVWVLIDGDINNGKASTGGIKINGENLNPEYGYELNHGDVIQLSPNTFFRFFLEIDDRPQEGDTVF